MSHIVCEAVEVITDNGTGIPLTYSNTAVGLPSGGHFYLITDRPGLNGSKTITGDTSQTTWYEGILSRDYGAFLPSRSCDFVEFGGIEMVSGMSFSIVNTTAFWKTLQDNGIYLGNCVVKYYRVTSSDDVTYNFELRWTGVVDDQPFNELTYSVRCVDNSKALLQNTPSDAVDSIRFPNAPQGNLDKMIPIVCGRSAYSPLINVSGGGTKTNLCVVSGVTYNSCAAVSYIPGNSVIPSIQSRIQLKTPSVVFATNDNKLVGKYLVVIAGGTEQAIKIASNDASTSDGSTWVYLDDPLAGSIKNWTQSDTATNITYYQVIDFSPLLLLSERTIYQTKKNKYGRNLLFTYNSTINQYSDISQINGIFSASNINALGYPGFSIVSSSADISGGLNCNFPIIPADIKVVSVTSNNGLNFTSTLPAAGTSAYKLYNLDDSDFYTLTTSAPSASGLIITLDVYIPSDQVLQSYSELYLLMDMVQYYLTSAEQLTLNVVAYAYDIYGRVTTAVIPSYNIINVTSLGTSSSPTAAPGLLLLLPTNYFGQPASFYSPVRSDKDFNSQKGSLKISSLVTSSKNSTAYNRIRLVISTGSNTDADTYTMLLKEVGIVGKRAVTTATETIYAGTYGETFGSTWGGRKTSALPAFTMADALEKIIRDYNLAKNVWGALKAYSIGDKVRSIADNGHLYICSVAGTSGANAAITGAANNGSGLIRITSAAHGMATGNKITISGVAGTTEANGNWTITVISSSTYDLQGSTFTHAYTSGGTVVVNFPTGSGATVTDGTVTWTEAGLIPIDTTTFDTLSSQRSTWFVGRTLTEKKPTVDYITEMAKQGFFIVLTDATGKIKAKAWRENTTALATFSSSNIIPGTLLELKPTPMRRVSNDLTIKYDENPGSSGFNKQIVITNINRPTFPSNTETLVTGTNLGSFTITSNIDIVGNYYFTITTTAAHGLSTGAIVSLTGNADGYNFTPRAIAVISTTQISVSPGQITTASSSSSGTLYSNPVSTLKWQTFVSGVINYTTAKGIWTQCHNSFVLTKRVQKLATAGGECKWFIDPLAKDPGGNYIWSDTVTPTYDITNVADDHPAVFYAKNLSEWTAWQKKQATFETIDTTALSALEIGDPVYLNDAKLTNGSNLLGWIHEKTQLAKTDKLPYRFRFGVTLNPEQLNPCNRIIDTPNAANRILDTVGATNRILDTPC